MLPDLQSAVICEDVRCEVNGMQTLVGVDIYCRSYTSTRATPVVLLTPRTIAV